MNDASRTQGWVICLGAGFLAFLFIVGLLKGSYWALAIPVAVCSLWVCHGAVPSSRAGVLCYESRHGAVPSSRAGDRMSDQPPLI